MQQCYPQHPGSPGVISLLPSVLLPRELGSLKTGRFLGDLAKAEAYFALTTHFSFFLISWGPKEDPRVQVGSSREKEGDAPMEYEPFSKFVFSSRGSERQRKEYQHFFSLISGDLSKFFL